MKTVLHIVSAAFIVSGLVKLVLAFVQWRSSRRED